MEILDLYDNKRNKLNKTIIRSEKGPLDGEYSLSVHIWLLNSKGEILIQKRNENLKKNPGKWGFTSGAVDAGETSLEGVIRETKEELGITVKENEIEFLLSFKREKAFIDVWLVKKDIAISDFVLQKEEVSEVKWVSLKQLIDLVKSEDAIPSTKLYIDLFVKLLERCHGVKSD